MFRELRFSAREFTSQGTLLALPEPMSRKEMTYTVGHWLQNSGFKISVFLRTLVPQDCFLALEARKKCNPKTQILNPKPYILSPKP